MSKISNIQAYKVLNSRGNWTVKTEVTLDDGSVGTGEIPEGASKGAKEAISLSAEASEKVINGQLARRFCGAEIANLKELDDQLIEIDGTPDKAKLGENSILSVSMAFARATAQSLKLPLYKYLAQTFGVKEIGIPTPVFNVINGGKHANNNLSFQEFMFIPARRLGYNIALDAGVRVYQKLKSLLSERGFDVDVGDEGGFAPIDLTAHLAFNFIEDAVEDEKLRLSDDAFLGMDLASNSFYNAKEGKYEINEEGLSLTPHELFTYYERLLKKYPLIYTEDAFIEDDLESWKIYNDKFKDRLLVVGDDLTVTNTKRLEVVSKKGCCNAVIVKPNQIGTLSETFAFVKLAKQKGFYTIMSHRSGEAVEDTFIADFAVAVNADYFKAGAPAHERVAKYNKLLEIFNELNGPIGSCQI